MDFIPSWLFRPVVWISFLLSLISLAGILITRFGEKSGDSTSFAVASLGFSFTLCSVTFAYSRGLEKTKYFEDAFQAGEWFFLGMLLFGMALLIKVEVASERAKVRSDIEPSDYVRICTFLVPVLSSVGFLIITGGLIKLVKVLLNRLYVSEEGDCALSVRSPNDPGHPKHSV